MISLFSSGFVSRGPGVILTLYSLVGFTTGRFILRLALLFCSRVFFFFFFFFFISFSIVIIERACLCASRAFVAFFARVVFVLLLSSWCEGLAALITVALP